MEKPETTLVIPVKREPRIVGHIPHASLMAGTELAKRAEVREGQRFVSLLNYPEHVCSLRDAVAKYIQIQFGKSPAYSRVSFDFAMEAPSALKRITQQLDIGKISWPYALSVRIVREGGTVRVSYDDWSKNLSDKELYFAKLLS